MTLDKNYNNLMEIKKEYKEKAKYNLESCYLNLLNILQKENNTNTIQTCLDQYQLSYIEAIEYLNEEEKQQYYIIMQRAKSIISKLKSKPIQGLETASEIEKANKNSLLQDIDSGFIKVQKAMKEHRPLSEIVDLLQWYYFTIINAGSSLTKEEATKYQEQYLTLINKINNIKRQEKAKPTYIVNGTPISRIRFHGHEIESNSPIRKK